jgi:hypothetical protein
VTSLLLVQSQKCSAVFYSYVDGDGDSDFDVQGDNSM